MVLSYESGAFSLNAVGLLLLFFHDTVVLFKSVFSLYMLSCWWVVVFSPDGAFSINAGAISV